MSTGPTLSKANTGSPDWTRLRGVVLEGGYEIEDLLEADARSATFTVRVLADSAASAVAAVVEAPDVRGEEQLALWQSAKRLRHPNLNPPLAAGRTSIGAARLVYVISRRPPEVLSDVLPKRALRLKEVDELLRSVAPALEHLHSHGFVHGYLSPAEVFAFRDSIVLSLAHIRSEGSPPPLEWSTPKYRAPENAAENVTRAADIWCLGATLFEALTQKPCESGCREEAARLASPFNRVVEHCLDPDPETRSKQHVEAVYEAAMAASALKKPAAPLRQPSVGIARGWTQPASRVRLREAEFRSARGWIYVAAFVVLVVVILLARSRYPRQRAQSSENSGAIVQTKTTGAKAKASWPPRTIAPDGTSAVPPAVASPANTAVKSPPEQPTAPSLSEKTAGEPRTINGPIWRVVLYTYAYSKDAENRASFLNAKYPGLNAETFSPNGSDGPFLVIAGGRMDHDDAARLRQKLLRMGLPHDTYIQNYKQ